MGVSIDNWEYGSPDIGLRSVIVFSGREDLVLSISRPSLEE
jgi:hypothetical protein